jgi:hypothetical protein
MNYPNNNLYLITFKDDSANFYVEQNQSLVPLFENKTISDTSKILNCAGFANNRIDCDSFVKTDNNIIPENIHILKIFPSNLDARKRFFDLLEEQQESKGGKRRRRFKTLKRRRTRKTISKRRLREKSRRKRRYH